MDNRSEQQQYDFTSEDGERYYIDYHEGKLEEYLNVREMQPGGKYMLLYYVAILIGLLLVTYVPFISMGLPSLAGMV